MKYIYPVILIPSDGEYVVSVPDFDIMTQGSDLADAIDMARDAISLMGVDYQDDGKPIPKPSEISDIKHNEGEIATLVDVDFDSYRRMLENRAIRKNCTIPAWLNAMSEKEHINFSAVLQEALMKKLNINK